MDRAMLFLLVILAATVGAILLGVLGWLDQRTKTAAGTAPEPWSWAKFWRTCITSLLSGVVLALGQDSLPMTGVPWYITVASALAMGAAIDVTRSRVFNVAARPAWPPGG
ncbi:MAG: hypothetical protein Q7T33_02505 [Dehalococcoidia bacterium]|nr:hypothetical protein [Dehalococcoidia bacterium]